MLCTKLNFYLCFYRNIVVFHTYFLLSVPFKLLSLSLIHSNRCIYNIRLFINYQDLHRLLSRNRHCNWEWGWRLSDVDPSIDQSGFSRKERNLHCDVHATYTSPLKTNTYCRRSGRQTRCGWRDRSDPDVAIKAYSSTGLAGGNPPTCLSVNDCNTPLECKAVHISRWLVDMGAHR